MGVRYMLRRKTLKKRKITSEKSDRENEEEFASGKLTVKYAGRSLT